MCLPRNGWVDYGQMQHNVSTKKRTGYEQSSYMWA